jgi:hypothetical protein
MSSPFCRFDKHQGKDGDPLISSQHTCNDSKNKELTGSRHFQFPFALCLVILCSHTLSSPTFFFMGLLKLVPQITKRSFRDIPICKLLHQNRDIPYFSCRGSLQNGYSLLWCLCRLHQNFHLNSLLRYLPLLQSPTVQPSSELELHQSPTVLAFP